MNAKEARKIETDLRTRLQKKNDEWRRKDAAKTKRKFDKRKAERWDSLMAEIDALITKSANHGRGGFLSDDIVYFKGEDEVLYDAAVKHFENEGFKVTRYVGSGLMLEW